MSWATAPKRPPRTARKYMPFFGRRAVHITRRSAMRRVGFSATTASRSRSTRRREPMEPSTIITLQDQRARYAVRLHHLPVGYASTAGPRLGTLLRRNRLLVIVKICGGNGSGAFGDRAGRISGLKGGAMFPGGVLLLEGFALIVFSQMTVLPLAILSMLVFSLFVQMSGGRRVLHRALHQQARPWRSRGNCGRGRQRRSGRRRVPLQDGACPDGAGPPAPGRLCHRRVLHCLPCPLLPQDRGGRTAGYGQGARQGRRRFGPAARHHGPVSVAPEGGDNETRQQSRRKGQGGKGRLGHPRGNREAGLNPLRLGDALRRGPGTAQVDRRSRRAAIRRPVVHPPAPRRGRTATPPPPFRQTRNSMPKEEATP